MYTLPEKFHFTLSEEARHERFLQFVAYLRGVNPALGVFVEQQEEGFYQNIVNIDYGKIRKGDKLVKAFKHFESDPSQLRCLQDRASHIIQEDKIEGYLTISVHPFDYLTLSENNHHWTSCHNLNGDYCAGNLAYMVDRSTLVCYLSNNKMESLPNCPEDFKWTSKKWRCLLYMSDNADMIFASRQYPFEHMPLLDLVLNQLLPKSNLIQGNEWVDWQNTYIEKIPLKGFEVKYSRSIPLGDGIVSLANVVKNFSSLIFNDLLYSPSYVKPFYTYKCAILSFADDDEKVNLGVIRPMTNTHFNLGGQVQCLCCEKNKLTFSEMIYCPQCMIEYGDYEKYPGVFKCCEQCGEIIVDGEEYVINDCEAVCENCAAEANICVECGNAYTVDIEYFDDVGWVCGWCQTDQEEL